MIKTRHLNVRADIEDFEKIQANAKSANMTISDFLRDLGLKFTPEVRAWFKPLFEQFLKGKSQTELAEMLRIKNENDVVIKGGEKLLKTIDNEQVRIKTIFEEIENKIIEHDGKRK